MISLGLDIENNEENVEDMYATPVITEKLDGAVEDSVRMEEVD